MKRILTARQIAGSLERLYQAVVAQLPTQGRIAVVGVRTRGDLIAKRLVQRLAADRPDLAVETGVLDITFYRDDLQYRGGAPLVRATEISFDINDTWLLLVDDVLATGRSVRAALDALHDFGRPKVVKLAVLIDRGGRELPISADFIGKKLKAPSPTRVQVKLKESDGEEGVFIIRQEQEIAG